MRLLIIACTLCVCVSGTAVAQPPAAPAQPEPQPSGSAIGRIGERVYKIFGNPVHPTIEPVAPTGGLAVGIGASPEPLRKENGMLGFEGRTSFSVKKYWIVEGSTWWQGSNKYRVEGYGRSRSMRELDFYGLGNDSLESSQSDFHLTDSSVGGLAWVRPVVWLGVGGRLEELWPDVKTGRNSDLPSTDTLYTESTLPGIGPDQPSFLRTQVFVDINYPSSQFERPRNGGDYQVAYNIYNDQGSSSLYSFRRFNLEMQQRFGLGPRPGRLTLHLWLSTVQTDAGKNVPFYLMPTLGGSHNLMAFNEQIIGGDETKATLRGFDDFRFRDRNLLLLQAEYRFKIWGPVHATVFVDGGQVTADAGDLSLSRLKGDAGFSLSLMRSDSTIVRLDFGFGGGEGFHHFLNPGRVLAP